MKKQIAAKRYFGWRSVLVALLAGAAGGIAASLFWEIGPSLAVGCSLVGVLLPLLPLCYAGRTRALDAPAASHGDTLLLNEPVLILSEKRRFLGRLCLTADTLYLYFKPEGRIAYVAFQKKDSPLISYGQSREFLSVRAKDGRSGAYICSDDLLSNMPLIYEGLKQSGWTLL